MRIGKYKFLYLYLYFKLNFLNTVHLALITQLVIYVNPM